MNRLPQGSVISLVLYDIYIQTISRHTRELIYPDDTAVAVQEYNFEGAETGL